MTETAEVPFSERDTHRIHKISTSPNLSSQNSISWLLSACCFASAVSLRACDTLLPTLADEFSVTVGQAARVIFVFAIAYGAFQLCFGPLGDRYGKLRVIALCALACVMGNTMAVMAPDLDWLVAARILSGACAAGIIPLALAWIGDNVPYASRQAALAGLMSATVMGMLAGQWVVGMIAEGVGWRPAFALIACLFLLTGGLLLRAVAHQAPPAAASSGARRTLLGVIASPTARWILTVTAIEGALAFGAIAFIPSALQRQYGISMSMAGGIAACYGVGGFIYTRMASRVLARTGESGLARLSGILLLTGFVSFAYVPALAWTPVACLLVGFGFYGLHNTLQTNATQMAPTARGAAMSLFACCLFLGQSAGVMGAAWVADHLTDSLIFVGAGGGLVMLSFIAARRFR
ncbi:MFS transporter [Alcaligenaceae bacterium]|nr:MFS transporter [Alcaligenaceae bacterium]